MNKIADFVFGNAATLRSEPGANPRYKWVVER